MDKQHSEEDIEKAINFLKTNHPEVPAIREEAIKLLNGMQTFAQSFVTVANKQSKNSKKN